MASFSLSQWDFYLIDVELKPIIPSLSCLCVGQGNLLKMLLGRNFSIEASLPIPCGQGVLKVGSNVTSHATNDIYDSCMGVPYGTNDYLNNDNWY
jgi:hypothetical protein